MVGPGGKTLRRASNMTQLMLLGMVPLFATGQNQGVLGREEADGRGFLRNGSGRNLQAGGECGVDFPGIRSSGGKGKFCCVEECGQCGGEGCSGFASHLGFTKEHCCTSAIKDAGAMCSDTMAAPCVIASGGGDSKPSSTPEPVPEATVNFDYVRCSAIAAEDAGETAFDYTVQDDNLMLSTCYEACAMQSALYFAVLEGDECACGSSSEFLQATDKPLGECDIACPGKDTEACGGSSSYNLYEILASDDGEVETLSGGGVGSADSGDDDPSASSDPPTCSSGIVGVESESGDVCCSHKCGTCGGSKCVGWGDCCEETIQAREGMCSDTNEAPCIYNKVDVDTPPPAPRPKSTPRQDRYCSNGIPGVESSDGKTCCWEGCLECNGYGKDCVGVTNCCEQAIHDSGVYCSDDGVKEGPCIM